MRVDLGAALRSRRARHRTALVVLWGGMIAAYQVWSVRNGFGPGEAASKLVDAVQGSALGVAGFVLAYLVRPLLFLPATLLTVAAGFLFGGGPGLALVIVVSNASAMIAYWVGRWFGDGSLVEGTGGGRLRGYIDRMRRASFETTLTLRLLLLPYDAVSYLAGFLRIRAMPFLAGTAIGSLPATVAFVLLGASIERFDGGVPSLDGRVLAVSIALLVVSLVLVRFVRRREGAADGV